MEDNFTYTLTKSFDYSFKGEIRKADFITLFPPTMKQHNAASELKQSMIKMVRVEYSSTENIENLTKDAESLTKESDKKEDEDSEITAELILSMIFGSTTVDVNVIFEQAKELFRLGLALVDGEQKLTAPLIEKMSIEDFRNLVGEYIANFILA